MKHFILILSGFLVMHAYGQKPILIYDLKNHTVDSVKNIPVDSTMIRDQTRYFRGIDTLTELLEQTPPVTNLFPNSQFTRKKQASLDYDITKYPIRTSVKLFSMKNDTLSSNCSGSMISRRHVLTAAHCVADFSSDSLTVDSIKVCPIYDNGQTNPDFPCSWVSKIFIFKNRNIAGEDFAILELEESIGDLTGWISIGFDDNDSSLLSGIYYKFTYPAHSIIYIDSALYNGDTLYYNYGKADIAEERMVGINNTNGIPGESGSSIIKVENNNLYTTYGVLSFSTNLSHSRINRWRYYYLESVIHNDLNGIEEESNDRDIVIFPNPSNDKVWIKNSGASGISGISIFDIWGNLKVSQKITSSGISLDCLPAGLYFVRIELNNSFVTKKLIIERN